LFLAQLHGELFVAVEPLNSRLASGPAALLRIIRAASHAEPDGSRATRMSCGRTNARRGVGFAGGFRRANRCRQRPRAIARPAAEQVYVAEKS